MTKVMAGWGIVVVAALVVLLTYALTGDQALALAVALVFLGVAVFDGIVWFFFGLTLSKMAHRLWVRDKRKFAIWVAILFVAFWALIAHFVG